MEGGLPAWKSKGFDLESVGVSDDAIHAAAKACRASQSSTKYRAKLDKLKVGKGWGTNDYFSA